MTICLVNSESLNNVELINVIYFFIIVCKLLFDVFPLEHEHFIKKGKHIKHIPIIFCSPIDLFILIQLCL